MTSPEVRSVVTAVYRIHDLLEASYPPSVRRPLELLADDLIDWCRCALQKNQAGLWALPYIGPVLAAGMGATTSMHNIPAETDLLRVFGFAGERSLLPKEAWRHVQPFAHEPVLSPEIIARISIVANIRFRKLPPYPSPVDALVEMTRERSAPFMVQMSRWLANYFRTEGHDNSPYVELYHKTLNELQTMNRLGEMALTVPHCMGTSRQFSREDWMDVLRDRVPQFRLEEKAGFRAAKQFLLDYYARCKKKG